MGQQLIKNVDIVAIFNILPDFCLSVWPSGFLHQKSGRPRLNSQSKHGQPVSVPPGLVNW